MSEAKDLVNVLTSRIAVFGYASSERQRTTQDESEGVRMTEAGPEVKTIFRVQKSLDNESDTL